MAQNIAPTKGKSTRPKEIVAKTTSMRSALLSRIWFLSQPSCGLAPVSAPVSPSCKRPFVRMLRGDSLDTGDQPLGGFGRKRDGRNSRTLDQEGCGGTLSNVKDVLASHAPNFAEASAKEFNLINWSGRWRQGRGKVKAFLPCCLGTKSRAAFVIIDRHHIDRDRRCAMTAQS